MKNEERMRTCLVQLYGPEVGGRTWLQLAEQLKSFQAAHPHLARRNSADQGLLTEKDAILITYGDQFTQPGQAPLVSLATFLAQFLADTFSGVHILPFFPYSSDDGFSVIDYLQVESRLGTWEDVNAIASRFRLMVDAVVNHISRQSRWFQKFLQQVPPYDEYFISVDPGTDLSMVVRPRSLPLLTAVETVVGTKYVWTTFSDDQMDLNYANPQVLLEMLEVLLTYIAKGAQFIRLDAIAYVWKEPGTPCIHLPQTHQIVKLLRALTEAVAPGTVLITETNVPHEDNISYFGQPVPGQDHYDEAHMVYQFPLAPLVLHTFHTGDATILTEWASRLEVPSRETTFFNFLASHDGLGVMPAQGLLSAEEIQALVERTLQHGGLVSYKTNPDGSRSVYELNITLYDALNDPLHPQPELDLDRFLAAHAIMLSLIGVPGVYVHSLFGSHNCLTCVEQTGRARSINREKFDLDVLETALQDPHSHQRRVFEGMKRLLRVRREHRAFHPASPQQVLRVDPSVLTILRTANDRSEAVLCAVNTTPTERTVNIPGLSELGIAPGLEGVDLLAGRVYRVSRSGLSLRLKAYGLAWFLFVLGG